MFKLNPTLKLYQHHKVLFSNTGRGLEPLMELKNFIERYIQNKEGLIVHDKVVGKAAAILLHQIGIKHVYSSVLSDPARIFFEDNNIEFKCKKLVPKLNNKIDDLISGMSNSEDIYNYLLANHYI